MDGNSGLKKSGLSTGKKIAGVAIFILLGWGSFIGMVATSSNTQPVSKPIPSRDTLGVSDIQQVPAIETKEETEDQEIPFTVSTQNDGYLENGATLVKTEGVNGIKTLTYKVTYEDGVETSREKVKEEVSKAPINKVVLKGTKVATPPPPPPPAPRAASSSSNCDPNYAGDCVPIASDVDCASGNGNGPAYVVGPVIVIGTDIYGLDGNGDGEGCES